MSQQTNKVQKQSRRRKYLKRLKQRRQKAAPKSA